MKIEIETSNLSPLDRRLLAVLAEGDFPVAEQAPAPAAEETKKPAPAKKAAPAKAKEPEPEEDLVGADAPTMADAVAAATQLVSSGQAAKVKAALTEVGAKRVAEVEPEKIAAFLAALA